MDEPNPTLQEFVDRFEADFCGELDDDDFYVISQASKISALAPIYSLLPGKFPPLYEELVLSYRWPRADVGRFRLLANPPGNGYAGLLEEICCDKPLFDLCTRNGYIQFGRGPDVCYDPICFDTTAGSDRKNFPVMQLDHEEILCNDRIRVVAVLARSFEELVLRIISA